MIAFKNHQFDMIRSDRKLQFYSTFKTDQSISLQLELIKNVYHRQSVAKLRSGNHTLTGRHCVPKIPEDLRICQNCSSSEVENVIHKCNSYKCIRKTFFNDIILKYLDFNTLSEGDKILFLFNNIDPFICKKLGNFIFEAFQKRKQRSGF